MAVTVEQLREQARGDLPEAEQLKVEVLDAVNRARRLIGLPPLIVRAREG